MKPSNKFLILLFTFLNLTPLFSQTTADYFSRPGLSINAFTVDFFGDTSSTSYSFSHKTIVCGDTALVMAHNLGGTPIYLVFEDKKVYRTNFSCVRNLILDFGLNVGQIMHDGPCDGCVVVAKHDTMLLNGDSQDKMRTQTYFWIISSKCIEDNFN